MLEALIFVVFPFCMVFAALSDMLSMTIATRVPLLLIALATFILLYSCVVLATSGAIVNRNSAVLRESP